ncbi:MAG: outer membrane protein OmpA-like peptidoglycan-associated protein [Arenicella sp.]|jgi:outer membrane protein OmpA-like peptidoglycan-associated protein
MPKFILSLILFSIVFQSQNAFSQELSETVIYFESGSYELDSVDKEKIKRVVAVIKSPRFSYMKIFGYASPAGNENYNLTLSEKRANVVLKAISEFVQLHKSNMYVAWIGESEYAYSLHYKNSHHQQKCVDIVLQLKATKK